MLDQRERLANERLDEDILIEVRSFGKLGTCAFTFARRSGPYVLVGIEKGRYFKDVVLPKR
jgi:hypothetical protein